MAIASENIKTKTANCIGAEPQNSTEALTGRLKIKEK